MEDEPVKAIPANLPVPDPEVPDLFGLDPRFMMSKKRRPRVTGDVWHKRLAHIHADALRKLFKIHDIKCPLPKHSDCETCIKAKMMQSFHKNPVPRAKLPFERIYADVCGPMPVRSLNQKRYYLVLVDDCTRYTTVYYMHKKSEVRHCWSQYKAWIKTQHNATVKKFHSDNGGEFLAMEDDFKEDGIEWERSPPYSQHKNGVAERMIRTLNTKARCLLFDGGLPSRFWAEAVNASVQLHRLTPQVGLNWSSPHQRLYGSQISIDHPRRFGCLVYTWLGKDQRKNKLGARASRCVMLGYVHRTIRLWRLWDIDRKRIIESSNAHFVKHENAWHTTFNDPYDVYENPFPEEAFEEMPQDDEVVEGHEANEVPSDDFLKYKGTSSTILLPCFP